MAEKTKLSWSGRLSAKWTSRRGSRSPAPKSPVSRTVPENEQTHTEPDGSNVPFTDQIPFSAMGHEKQLPLVAPQVSSKTFWDRAYEQMKIQKPKLLTVYESIVLEEAKGPVSLAIDHKQMSSLLERKLQEIDDARWRIMLGQHTVCHAFAINTINPVCFRQMTHYMFCADRIAGSS